MSTPLVHALKVTGRIGAALVGAAGILAVLLYAFPGGRIRGPDSAAFVHAYLEQVPGARAPVIRETMTTPAYQSNNPEVRTDGRQGFSQFWGQIGQVTDIKVEIDPSAPSRPLVSYNYVLLNGKAKPGPVRSAWDLSCWGAEALIPGRDCSIEDIRLDATFAAPDSPGPESTPSENTTPEQLALRQPICKQKGACRVFKSTRVTTGTGSVSVVALDVFKDGANESVHVMIFDSAGELDWDQGLATGYGMVDLATDTAGHVFVEHAVSNDTSEVLVFQATPQGVNTFSTLGDDVHPNAFSTSDNQGNGAVYVAREGMPARKWNLTTSRDRYVITGDRLRWTGCEVVSTSGEVVEERAIGTPLCRAPVTLPPMELPESDRAESDPPP